MAEAIRRATLGTPVVAVPGAVPRPTARTVALPTVPAHVGTMLGLSVAGYGVALALVTGLQASTDAAVIANRDPISTTIDRIADGHDRLARDLGVAAGQYAAAAADYQAVVDGLAGVEGRLGALAGAVSAVDGASKALPASVALPPVVRSVRAATVTKATTHATSGGSAAP
jgi:hypothetical protein